MIFGTGYANLSQLQQVKVDFLKIDKSFVQGIEVNNIRSGFFKKIIEIANQLETPVIVEGIENKAQLEIVRKFGVRFIQGFYFAKPMTASELNQYVLGD